jgi:bifunctional non-homologous end joining protein LigD
LKHDGFRAVAYVEDGTYRLISRKQIQYKSFAGLATALAALPVTDAILDGEIVCLDQDGRSQFRQLMRRRSQDVSFYAFDLIWHNGIDLRGLPLLERKSRLRALVRGPNRIPLRRTRSS